MGVCTFDSAATGCMPSIDFLNDTEYQWSWQHVVGQSANSATTGLSSDAHGSASSGYLYLNSQPGSQVCMYICNHWF